MLKTTGLLDKPIPSKNNGSKSISNKNNNSRPIFSRNDGNGEVDGFVISENGVEHAKKLGKLFKSRKSKSEKMSKSRNLAKLRKKLSKSGNLTNFNVTKDRPKFLTPNARISLNHLQLNFIKAPIL